MLPSLWAASENSLNPLVGRRF